MKRIFLIVLDSCGAGAMPIPKRLGMWGSTPYVPARLRRSCTSPNLVQAGLGNVEGLSFLGSVERPAGAVARLAEASMGKDTTIGHWEIAGLVSPEPLPTYPEGFPREVLDAFEAATGSGNSVQPALLRDRGHPGLRPAAAGNRQMDRVYLCRLRISNCSP